MPKPTELPEWATDAVYDSVGETWDATATKVEPSAGKKAEGHEPGERTPAQEQNWWQNLVYEWIKWLEVSDNVDYPSGAWVPLPDDAVNVQNFSATHVLPLELQPGDKIVEVTLALQGDGTPNNITVGLVKSVKLNTPTTADALLSPGLQTYVNGGNLSLGWQLKTIDFADYEIQAGETFYLMATVIPTSGPGLLGPVRLVKDRA